MDTEQVHEIKTAGAAERTKMLQLELGATSRPRSKVYQQLDQRLVDQGSFPMWKENTTSVTGCCWSPSHAELNCTLKQAK